MPPYRRPTDDATYTFSSRKLTVVHTSCAFFRMSHSNDTLGQSLARKTAQSAFALVCAADHRPDIGRAGTRQSAIAADLT